ncbi:MAG: sodium-dependent transporter [Thermoanaerobaculia bacterium]
METSRGLWSSRLGFVMAAAGSAIGLGNIWRFPFTVGTGGGGAFVLVYLLCVLAVALPVQLCELAIGRATERNPVGAFAALSRGRFWRLVGGLGVFTGFGILAFYSVVAGWTVGYLWMALTGRLETAGDAQTSGAIFTGLIGNAGPALILTVIFLALTAFVVRGGVSKGIERATKVLMPALFVLLVVLVVRSLTLPGAGAGLAFYLRPDFSALSANAVMMALGQALFSLSLGMGAMITYGSYFPKSERLPVAGVTVAGFDTLIALLAGLLIFPALSSAGVEPNAGPGLVFVVLPTIFAHMPLGGLFAVLFYLLLAIAALTSTISLLEVVVAYFVDERGWRRGRAAVAISAACFLLALPSALSQGVVPSLGNVFGMSFLDLQNAIFGNYSLSIGALLICLFVGWKWGIGRALDNIEMGGGRMPGRRAFGFVVRYVCPLAIAFVLGFIIYASVVEGELPF